MLELLRAREFRNLAELEWRPGPGAHLLLGGNGAGKTSVLEAVYVLATTRSFRTARIAECRRHGMPGFFLGGEVRREARWSLEVSDTDEGRQRTVNGRNTSLAEHLTPLPVLSWSEADQGLLTGGPEGRRRFLDRGILGARPASLADFGRYRRILREKRALLASGRPDGLSEWNRLLAQSGTQLATRRAAAVAELGRSFAELCASIDLDLPRVELRYRPSPKEAVEGEEALFAAIERLRPRELARRRPLTGPHRDEVELLWPDGVEVKRHASAGERKAIGLIMLAAQAQGLRAVGREPLLLLDDLDTELDARRLSRLWGLFESIGQLLVSSNRPSVWEPLESLRRWWVLDGRVEGSGPP